MVGCDGDLVRRDLPDLPTVRKRYSWHYRQIDTVDQLKATLRAGAYAWPGGYPLYFITEDGAALSFESARKEFKHIAYAVRFPGSDRGWRVVACEVNYEDNDLRCEHSGKPIESAYGERVES